MIPCRGLRWFSGRARTRRRFMFSIAWHTFRLRLALRSVARSCSPVIDRADGERCDHVSTGCPQWYRQRLVYVNILNSTINRHRKPNLHAGPDTCVKRLHKACCVRELTTLRPAGTSGGRAASGSAPRSRGPGWARAPPTEANGESQRPPTAGAGTDEHKLPATENVVCADDTRPMPLGARPIPDTSSGTPDAGGIRSRPGETSGLSHWWQIRPFSIATAPNSSSSNERAFVRPILMTFSPRADCAERAPLGAEFLRLKPRYGWSSADDLGHAAQR